MVMGRRPADSQTRRPRPDNGWIRLTSDSILFKLCGERARACVLRVLIVCCECACYLELVLGANLAAARGGAGDRNREAAWDIEAQRRSASCDLRRTARNEVGQWEERVLHASPHCCSGGVGVAWAAAARAGLAGRWLRPPLSCLSPARCCTAPPLTVLDHRQRDGMHRLALCCARCSCDSHLCAHAAVLRLLHVCRVGRRAAWGGGRKGSGAAGGSNSGGRRRRAAAVAYGCECECWMRAVVRVGWTAWSRVRVVCSGLLSDRWANGAADRLAPFWSAPPFGHRDAVTRRRGANVHG